MGKWKEKPRYKLVCTRLSDEEYEWLQQVVKVRDAKVSDVLRMLIREAT